MVVALGAGDRHPEPCAPYGVDAVDECLDAELLGLDAAFHVDHGIAEEAGGGPKFQARGVGGRVAVGEDVAGELLDGELVEGFVGVERIDDPVAVGPDRTRAVLLEAVGVRIARGVEPPASPLLAVVRRGQQTIHEPGVGVAGTVG